MFSLTRLSLSLLTLALPLISASPVADVVPSTAELESLNQTLSTRTFSHFPSIWDKGGWWASNDCRDASKSAICFSRGFGWGCNSQCICIQPPQYDGCKHEPSWKKCQSKGHGWGCNKRCECVPPPQECKSSLIETCRSKGKGASESPLPSSAFSAYPCMCMGANDTDGQCQCECRPWVKFYCQKKGGWLSDDCKCNLPTAKPKHHRSLSQQKRGVCPLELSACAVDPSAKRPLFECIDTTSTLDSCGGCSSEGTGVDCSQIEGADDVLCEGGRCVVRQCEKGWDVNGDGSACERAQGLKVNDTYWGGVFRSVKAGSKVVLQ